MAYVEIKELTKVINKQDILCGITLVLERGKIYGIKGKNGSGKTMLLRAICGLIKPTSGSIHIDGKLLGEDMTFPDSVGVLIEYPGFIDNLSGYENLKILAEIRGAIGKDKVEEIMGKVGLEQNCFKKKFKTYSLGMKQKLGIAAAIMEEPQIILLDEPTNALDEESASKIMTILNEERDRGALIIVASHDLEELERLSDYIFVMEKGKVKEQK